MESTHALFAFTRYGYRQNSNSEPAVVHSHPQFEIGYIHFGGGSSYMLGGRKITVESGDLILLSGLTRHGLHSSEHGMISTKLIFEPYFEQIFNTSLRIGNPLEPFKRLRNARIRLGAKERIECEHILTQVNRFYDERDHRQYTRLLVAFYDLLLFIGGQYGDSEVEVSYPSLEKELLTNEVIEFIEQHFTEELRLDSIESKFHMSKYHLSRTFTEVTGLTIFEYLCQRRINQAKLLLHQENSANLVSDVCYRVGYNHPEHFSRVFKKLVGMSPNQYRKLIR